MSASNADILDSIADELEAHPERWTQGCNARDRNGGVLDWTAPQAVCWCEYGHILKRKPAHIAPIMVALESFTPTGSAVVHNDTPGRTVTEIIEWNRAAARLLREQEAV